MRKWMWVMVSLLLHVAVTAEERNLRVLSYNIHHGRGMDNKLNLERIAKVIAAQKPDIVALQEVDKKSHRSKKKDQAAELAKLLGMQYRFGKSINIKGGEYGLAILSSLPISEAKVHKLPGGGEPRIAFEVLTKWRGKPFSFVTLHLERNFVGARDQQVSTLMKIFKTHKHPVILAGDFNAHRGSDAMQQLVTGGWSVLKKNDAAGVRTFHGEKHRKDSDSAEREEIDFIVQRGLPPFTCTHGVVQELMASDHRPIFAEFHFKN